MNVHVKLTLGSRYMRHQEKSDIILMTRKEASQRYSVSLRNIDYLIHDSVIPTIKLGRRCIRIPVADADKAILQFRTGGKIKP